LSGAKRALEAFLFAPVDARAAAWLRLAFAAAIPFFFRSHGLRAPGWALGAAARLYEDVLLTDGYMALIVALSTLLALGWRPRATISALVLVLVPLDFLEAGAASRQVMLLALASFGFLRSDAVRWPWQPVAPAPLRTAGPAWPIRLIQLLLTVLYGANAIAKTTPDFLSGRVLLDYSMELPNLRVDLADGTLDLGFFVIPVAVAASVATLTEYFLAVAFWIRRLRWVAAFAGVVFHGVLARLMTIFMLDYAAVFLYLAFLLPLVRSPTGGIANPRTNPGPAPRALP
jgi:hypothetical protein